MITHILFSYNTSFGFFCVGSRLSVVDSENRPSIENREKLMNKSHYDGAILKVLTHQAIGETQRKCEFFAGEIFLYTPSAR